MPDKDGGTTRRTILKTGAAGAAAAALGGAGLFAATGPAAAASLTITSAADLSTDDGTFNYAAYGLAPLRFAWEGLDAPATYGEVETEFRVYDGGTSAAELTSGWTSGGTNSGALGDDDDGDGDTLDSDESSGDQDGNAFDPAETAGWGGGNDSNGGPGTTGFFEFNFGDPGGDGATTTTGAKGGLYAPVANFGSRQTITDARGRDVTVTPLANAVDPANLTAPSDGSQKTYTVELAVVCRAYDGDPASGATALVSDRAEASFGVPVTNKTATATVTADGSSTSG